jgi:hypothetical protein
MSRAEAEAEQHRRGLEDSREALAALTHAAEVRINL